MDDLLRFQGFLVWLWMIYGVRGHCLEMPWKGDEAYEPKLAKLLALIDEYVEQGHRVSLVGASAGASAVINAYVLRKNSIQSVALICGKINFPHNVEQSLYDNNPAFKTSMYHLQKSLRQLTHIDKSKITSYFSKIDRTVPYPDTVIPGVKAVPILPLRHPQAIIYSISLRSSRIVKQL